MLVVTAGLGDASPVPAAVNATAAELWPTHALSLPAGLASLATASFDCVVVDVGVPDVAAVEVVRALRGRAGDAAIVVAVDDDASAAWTTELADVADRVLIREQFRARTWLAPVREAIERAHRQSQVRHAAGHAEQLAGIIDAVGDAVFTTTADRVVTSWNRGAEELFGYTAEEMIGTDVGILLPPGSGEPERIASAIARGQTVRSLETVRRTREGRLAEVSLSVTPLLDEGRIAGAVVVTRDITDRRELEAELVRQTIHDALTGLPNRSFLTFRLSQSILQARRRLSPVAVLFVDLDQFKAVNDVHGHLAGDRVLVEVADRLRSIARPDDTVARLGGDEFVLVCPDTDVLTADRMAQRIIELVAAPIRLERRDVQVGASVGIAVSPPLESDAEALLKHADAAMYEAKSRGRSRSQIFDVSFARRTRDQRLLAGDLREALAHGRLEVHYQPVVDLDTERVVGIEALARWRHPVRGTVAPGIFVPLAEDHGFVAELDRWVLARACRETAVRRALGDLPAEITVAVNLSARTLDDPGLVDFVAGVLQESGLPPRCLAIEITETALLQDRDAAKASLEHLRALGSGIFLDDFGTGYSSLSFLRELPVTTVKIDRSFIGNMAEHPQDRAITEAIVKLAAGLGLETIAEGVEDSAQRDLLRRLGCGHAQGHWWAAAVPMPDLVTFIRSTTPVRAGRSEVLEPALPPLRHRGRPARRTAAITAIAGVAGATAPAVAQQTACCLRAGLEAGQSWLVVTTPERRAAFAHALGALHAAAVSSGDLVELDAYDTLRQVTAPDGGLDPLRYEQVVGVALRALRARGGQVGTYAELGGVNQPLRSRDVAAELHQRMLRGAQVGLAYGDRPDDCLRHGPALTVLAAGDSTAS